MLEFNRAAAPLVEPVDRLARGHYDQVHPEVRAYFRDVNDHLLRVHEQLESYRDLLTSMLEANLAQVTVRQNEDVRKISAIVAIVAVPTMIAGIYGMNFEHMPELGWTFGYPLVLALMAASASGSTGTSRRWAGCSRLPPWPTTASSARSWPASCRRAVQEDEHTVAFMDINPWTRGHALVIPRDHSQEPLRGRRRRPGAPRPPARSAWRRGCATSLGCDGVNLLNCCEPAAWQTVFHFHIHVIPRYDDDPLELPVRPQQAEPGGAGRGGG